MLIIKMLIIRLIRTIYNNNKKITFSQNKYIMIVNNNNKVKNSWII